MRQPSKSGRPRTEFGRRRTGQRLATHKAGAPYWESPPSSPIPGSPRRPGLRLGDLSDERLDPALDLLQLVHSVRGWSDTQLVIRIEAVRRERSLQQAGRAGVDPYRDLPYWLVVLGDPRSTDPWAWRINGHHLLAQATVVGDQVNGVPHFFGA